MLKKIMTLALILSFSFSSFCVHAHAYGATPVDQAWTYIRAVKSGKYIDVPGGVVANNKAVQLYDGNATDAQRWLIQIYPDQYFTIRSALNTQYFLSIKDDLSSDGSNLVVEYFAPGTAIPSRAIFSTVSFIEDGVSMIFNKGSLVEANAIKVLEGQGGSTANGTSIVNWHTYSSYDSSLNQFWIFEDTNRSIHPFLQDHLVDGGGHCDWDGSTKYLSLVSNATASWNIAMGADRFRRDSMLTRRDLTIMDSTYNPQNSQAFAGTALQEGLMIFYTTQMDSVDGNIFRMKVVMHEFGHVLGIDHAPEEGNILTSGRRAYWTSLSLDDKLSYSLRSSAY